MTTPPAGASAPPTRFRRILPAVLVVVGVVMLVAVAASLLIPSLWIPSSRSVGWQLARGYQGYEFDPATAQTTTVVAVEVNWPSCAPQGDSWLATPAITYTPWAVTITMHTSGAFGDPMKCGGWYLTGMPVQIQLSEPLAGRTLFDGSNSPPGPRPYP